MFSMNLSTGLHSQHVILFVTYKWAQYARVIHVTRLEILAIDKRSSLMGPFASYKNDVLCLYSSRSCIHNILLSL
jgi:hypothetical protein